MKTDPSIQSINKILQLILFACISMTGFTQNMPSINYESHFFFQGEYPNDLEYADWFYGDNEVQGVTNDGENWYFTMTKQDESNARLWRIPKGVDLDDNVIGKPGVFYVSFKSVPELYELDLWHWGDPDHYNYEGENYIIVPVYQHGDDPLRAIACFRATDLSLTNFAYLPSYVHGGWCAVGIDSRIYTAPNNTQELVASTVDWESLTDENSDPFTIYGQEAIQLYKSDGSTPLWMTDMQGGEFSPSGEILYLVSGRGFCIEGAQWTPRDGIHAIETQNWTEVSQSVKNNNTDNYFNYNYDPGCVYCALIPEGTDTPEGITVWDLEDGSAPGISGSLHVLIDLYELYTPCNSQLSLYHYSSEVWVDHDASPGSGWLGRQDNPFQTVSSAYNYYPIWDGAQMIIKAGTYDDTGVYNKRIKMMSNGGSAIIGRQSSE